MAQLDDHIPSPESVLALLKGRRSIRLYKPDPVPDEMVEQLLEAGRWAPSASNRQPWAFIVVRDEAIRREVAQHAAYYFIRWAQAEDASLLIAMVTATSRPQGYPISESPRGGSVARARRRKRTPPPAPFRRSRSETSGSP